MSKKKEKREACDILHRVGWAEYMVIDQNGEVWKVFKTKAAAIKFAEKHS